MRVDVVRRTNRAGYKAGALKEVPPAAVCCVQGDGPGSQVALDACACAQSCTALQAAGFEG